METRRPAAPASLLDEGRECCVEISFANWQPATTTRIPRRTAAPPRRAIGFRRLRFGLTSTATVVAVGITSRSSPSRFASRSTVNDIDTGHVAARPVQALDKTELDRIFGGNKNDRDCRDRRLGRVRIAEAGADDHGDLTPHQIGRQRRQSIKIALCPAVLDRRRFGLRQSRSRQPSAERRRPDERIRCSDPACRNPITGIAGCCARAASGHAAAPPSSVMNSRRFTADASRASDRKDSTPDRQETAALREFSFGQCTEMGSIATEPRRDKVL